MGWRNPNHFPTVAALRTSAPTESAAGHAADSRPAAHTALSPGAAAAGPKLPPTVGVAPPTPTAPGGRPAAGRTPHSIHEIRALEPGPEPEWKRERRLDWADDAAREED